MSDRSDGDRDRPPGYRQVLLAEEERRRIAEGLHDGPIQWLASASLQVATMRRRGRLDSEQLESIEDILSRAIGSLRRMMFSLYPPDVDEVDYSSAIASLVEWVLDDSQIQPAIEVELEERIDDRPLRSVVFRVVQEAVTNAKHHSGANRVHISIVERGDTIRIRITDDGNGFDLAADPGKPGHLGLRLMRERTEAIGGRFDITTGAAGTTIEVDLPAQVQREDAMSVDGQDGLGQL